MQRLAKLRPALLVVFCVGLDLACTQEHAATAPAPTQPSRTWVLLAPMPTGRHGLAVAVVDSTLYAIGGLDSNGVELAVVEAYDPVADHWTARAPMPTARHGLAAGVIGGIIYVVGGRVGIGARAVQ